MTNLNLRIQKGAPLSFAEVDANFVALAEAVDNILTGQVFTNNAIAENAGIEPSKIAGTAVVDEDPRLEDAREPLDGTVTDEKVASDAAIAGTKISPNFGSQPITTTGALRAAGVATLDGLATFLRGAPVQADVATFLTGANLRAGVVVSDPAAPINLTLPTGAGLEGVLPDAYVGLTFQWSVINVDTANGVTVVPATGHTLVGNGAVAAERSALFQTRRTAINTFVSYRMA